MVAMLLVYVAVAFILMSWHVGASGKEDAKCTQHTIAGKEQVQERRHSARTVGSIMRLGVAMKKFEVFRLAG
jgi:hypothetical protein